MRDLDRERKRDRHLTERQMKRIQRQRKKQTDRMLYNKETDRDRRRVRH